MNSIKSIFSFLMLVFLTTSLSAQDLKQFIPKNAAFVVEINTKRINSKYDMNKLKEYDFMKMFEQQMEGMEGFSGNANALFNSPESAGIKANSSYYMYGTSKDDVMTFNMLTEIEDKSKLIKMVESMEGTEIQSAKDKSFQFTTYEGTVIAWNDKYSVTTFTADAPSEEPAMIPGEDMEDTPDEAIENVPPMDIETPDMPVNISPKKLKATMADLKGLFRGNAKNSIVSNPSFLKTMTNNHDIKLYLNYENGMPGRGNKMMDMPGLPPAMNKIMKDMYKGYTVDAGFDFNDGAVDVTMNTNMAGDMAKIFRSATNRTINKNFAKYIKKENLLGYFSMAYNIDNTVSTMKDVFSPMEKEIADAEKGLDGMLQSFGMGMTSNDIYKLLRGDFVLAMTGAREFEKEVTTYEYDDDFNRTEVKKMKKEMMPEFVMLFSSENQENVQKLFDMGKNMSMLAQGEKYYTAAIPGSPMDVNLTMQNGMLIVSNDPDLMNGNLKKGLKRKKRITKNHQKDLLLNSQTFFWDLGSTINLAKTMMPSDPTSDKLMTSLEDSMENITMNTSKMVGNTLVSKGKISFKNKKLNSIEQFFNLINEMNLIGESGMRM